MDTFLGLGLDSVGIGWEGKVTPHAAHVEAGISPTGWVRCIYTRWEVGRVDVPAYQWTHIAWRSGHARESVSSATLCEW